MPSPEATEGLHQFTSETVPSTDLPAAETVIDNDSYFQLPEPPDLGAFVPLHTSLPADGAQQLPEDSCIEAESVAVDADQSETTVHIGLTVIGPNMPLKF